MNLAEAFDASCTTENMTDMFMSAINWDRVRELTEDDLTPFDEMDESPIGAGTDPVYIPDVL